MSDSRIASRVLTSALLLALAGALALVAGLAAGPAWGWASLAILLAMTVSYHLRHLYAMGRWLERGDAPDVPRVIGHLGRAARAAAPLAPRGRAPRGRARRALWAAGARRRGRCPTAWSSSTATGSSGRNDTARMHLDLDPARDVGAIITNLVRMPEFVEYLDGGDYAHPVELRLADGRVLSIQVIAYGDAQRLVLSRDITRFERMERMRREFVANVSHEMRTPLTVISGFLETMREGGEDAADRARYLTLMSEQAQAHGAPGGRPAHAFRARVLAAAADGGAHRHGRAGRAPGRGGAGALRGQAPHRGRERARASSSLGSEKEITSALGNLVSNAIRYTPVGGTVRLRWHTAPTRAPPSTSRTPGSASRRNTSRG